MNVVYYKGQTGYTKRYILRLKQSSFSLFKHDYDSYLTFIDHESRNML